MPGRALLRGGPALLRTSIDALSVAVPMSRLDKAREDFIIESLLSVKARLSSMQEYSTVR